MTRIAIAAAVLAATALGSVAANAVEVGVGPGGVFVGERDRGYDRGYDHDWRWRHRETYGYADRCRVIVRTHMNRFGERVTERRRICD